MPRTSLHSFLYGMPGKLRQLVAFTSQQGRAIQTVCTMVQLSSKWQTCSGVGHGLENQGATCYINSTVQCLVHNPVLANLSQSYLKQICNCRQCALCYLSYRIRCSLDRNKVLSETQAGFPQWMVNHGLATLGTLSNDRLSAFKQVCVSHCQSWCYTA